METKKSDINDCLSVHVNKLETDIKLIWTKIYKNWFNKIVNFNDLVVPEIYDPEKHFVIIVAKGITRNEAVQTMKKKFDVFMFDNLEYRFLKDDRIADKDYVVLIKKNIDTNSDNESNEIHLNKETLLERLLLEIFYFDANGEHPYFDVNLKGSWCGVRWIHANWSNGTFYASLRSISGMDGDCWH